MLKAPATLSAVLRIEASEPCDWAWRPRPQFLCSRLRDQEPESRRIRFQHSGAIKVDAHTNAPRLAYSLFLLKVVAEVIDPVMRSFPLSCIKRHPRTIEATNIRMMNLLLVIYPSIGRL
jgi:hypothetical protein